MNTTTTDDSYRSWQRFRADWWRTITAADGLFGYDPVARARIERLGVPAYPYDPAWVLPARFEPATEAGTLDLQIAHHNGTKSVFRYGTVDVTVAGREYQLQVYSAPGREYHLSFRDATSGHTTYPGGRVVFIPFPDGHRGAFDLTLDLNRAVNGPCGYSELTACALPPATNTIDAAVTAGEQITSWMRATP